MTELQAIGIQLEQSPDKQVSTTDTDARSMRHRGTGIVGYNIQTAVDSKHHIKQDFIYNAKTDTYTCPAGQVLTKGAHRSDRRGNVNFYRHLTACSNCHLKSRCTPEKIRCIRRWDHEAIMDDVEHRLEDKPDAMRIRRSTVEYVFGTLKTWMGHSHFLTRTRKNVATKTSLHVLAYDFKRVLNIIALQNLTAAIKAA